MLITSNKIKEFDVVLFRLVDGTDIIAKFGSQTDTVLTVTRPLIVHLVNDPSGKGGGMAIQFIPLSVIHDTEEFSFNLSTITILPTLKVNDNLKKSYSNAVSPIEIPNKGLIV
jgi:hypothetical protein